MCVELRSKFVPDKTLIFIYLCTPLWPISPKQRNIKIFFFFFRSMYFAFVWRRWGGGLGCVCVCGVGGGWLGVVGWLVGWNLKWLYQTIRT